MKKLVLHAIILTFSSLSLIYAQEDPAAKGMAAINRNVLKAQLDFLASDWMEGRRAGEKGELISSDYIASMLRLYGVKPWGDKDASSSGRSYFQNFLLLRKTVGDHVMKLRTNENQTVKTTDFTYNVDFRVSQPAYNESSETEAPVVFAGYAFRNDKLKFNDLSRIDIKGKFIMKIAGAPAFAVRKLTRAELNSAASDFETYARDAGAAGIIEVIPNVLAGGPSIVPFGNLSPAEVAPRPTNEPAQYLIPGKENPNIPVRVSISLKTANEILRGTGNSIEEYIRKADANGTYTFQPIPSKTVFIRSVVNTATINVRNVLGIIEGSIPDEYIVLGAHYDHVGMNNGYIWNGADDNASGTVGVMTIAKALMETGKKPEKSVIVALWTAEEEGLLGSEYYIANLQHPLQNLKLNVNFDMISRYISEDLKENAVMTYTSANKSFRNITEENLKRHNIGLAVEFQPSDDPPGGSDHRTFVASGIPIMRFKPGHREEYHTPADEVHTIDWDIMEKIVKISFANVWELANTKW